MERVVQRSDLVAQVSPYLPEVKRGRPSFALKTMMRMHLVRRWFPLRGPAMDKTLPDMPELCVCCVDLT